MSGDKLHLFRQLRRINDDEQLAGDGDRGSSACGDCGQALEYHDDENAGPDRAHDDTTAAAD